MPGEAEQDSADIGDEDAELCGSAEQQALRVCNQRTEVCHRTNTHEDQGRKDGPLVHDVEIMKQSACMLNTSCIGVRLSHDIRIDIDEQHTKCDRYKKKRLKTMFDRQIQEHTCNQNHNVVSDLKVVKCSLSP